MSNETKKTALPKLRFPEFEDAPEWVEKSFDKLFTIGSGKDYKHLSKGDIPMYGSGGYMHSVNDYLYEGESVCIGRKGTIDKPMLLSGKFWTVDTLFYTHSYQECIPQFIYLIFQSIPWLKHNEAGGIPSLSKTIINQLKTYIPSVAEQQKIAATFSFLDDLITAQSAKLTALQAHKRGLMQGLFPAEGEMVPKLRFPEFQEAGEWRETTLGNECQLQDGFSFKSTDFVGEGEGTLQVVRITDINNKNRNADKVFAPSSFTGDLSLKRYLIQKGELLLSLTGAAGFNFFIWDGDKAFINQRTTKILPKDNSNKTLKWLLEPLIHNKINSHGEGQNNNLSREFLNAVEFLIPCGDEQQKIADCLSSLDARITAQSQKIEALKLHKKGLMQNLFPALTTTEA